MHLRLDKGDIGRGKGDGKGNAMQALDASAYQMLSSANRDFEDHLDGLIETALYNLKNEKRPKT